MFMTEVLWLLNDNDNSHNITNVFCKGCFCGTFAIKVRSSKFVKIVRKS